MMRLCRHSLAIVASLLWISVVAGVADEPAVDPVDDLFVASDTGQVESPSDLEQPADAAATEADAPASPAEPAWMNRTERPEVGSSDYRRSALRSMGAMIFVVGGLLIVHYWLRRKMLGNQPILRSNRLKVQSRLRLGPRQEVVVVEWEGEQVLLGVGPTFIQPLHRRVGAAQPGDFEETLMEEVGYGS